MKAARDVTILDPAIAATSELAAGTRLGDAPRGFRGHISALDVTGEASSLSPVELESRLLELGFVEGAIVEVLHEGLFGRDPIAVRVDHATIALRRREAMAILIAHGAKTP